MFLTYCLKDCVLFRHRLRFACFFLNCLKDISNLSFERLCIGSSSLHLLKGVEFNLFSCIVHTELFIA